MVSAVQQEAGEGAPSSALSARSPNTYEQVWRLQRNSMLQLAYLLVDSREAAEDVVQDAFLGLHREWTRITHPAAYLRTSVTNGCRSVLRRRRLTRLLSPRPDIPGPGAEYDYLLSEEHREVVQSLQRLQPRHREVLALKYWQDLGDEDIAAVLGISPSAVRAAASRGRHALAIELQARR
jgi:RNA polymerase sigma factor (sigma-70 family)